MNAVQKMRVLPECSLLKSTDTTKISKGIFTRIYKKMPKENPTLSDEAQCACRNSVNLYFNTSATTACINTPRDHVYSNVLYKFKQK